MRRSGLVVVDLDGTLTLDNSFHVFMWEMFTQAGFRVRARVVKAVLLRVLERRDAHLRLKRRVLRAAAALAPPLRDSIESATASRVWAARSIPIIDRVRDAQHRGGIVVLATAAPLGYATRVAALAGIEYCVASASTVDADWREVRGAQKLHAVREWAHQHGVPFESVTVMTDHIDDLPLLELASCVVLQGSGTRLAKLADRLRASVRRLLIDTEESDPEGEFWVWMDERFVGPIDRWECELLLTKHRYALLYCGDRWRRVRRREHLRSAVRRKVAPEVPPFRQRLGIAARRWIVRDVAGVFH